MRADLEDLLTLDRLVHQPARLVILTVLAEVEEAEFRFLEKVSGLTQGNLSGHIAKLEEAGYLLVKKYFRGKLPATSLKMVNALGTQRLENLLARQQLNRALQRKP